MRNVDSDTIAAIATAQGRAGIGVVRVSGKSLGEFARLLSGTLPHAGRVSYTAFRDAEAKVIDNGLLLYFQAPRSFTGEDVIELHAHGSPIILQMLLRRCLQLGARIAEPGEFTRRAFLNNKLDLVQAEAIADLIEASTEAAARSASRSLQGEFSGAVRGLAQQLIELRMLAEANLDFPEEDVDVLHRTDAWRRLQRLREHLAKTLNNAQQGSLLRTGLRVVLAGQPNVGKSSLLNRLAGEEVAIVTAVPGTTRDTVQQAIQIDGVPLDIVDTAGLRDTDDEVERVGIARTWKEVDRADLLVLIADVRAGIAPADEAIIARLPSSLKRIVAYNKIDLVDAAARVERVDLTTQAVYLSAKTGAGIELFKSTLMESVGWQPANEPLYLARERHLDALRQAVTYLTAAEAAVSRPELFAEELRLAQGALNAITGEFTSDDLLGEIFNRFCIGK